MKTKTIQALLIIGMTVIAITSILYFNSSYNKLALKHNQLINDYNDYILEVSNNYDMRKCKIWDGIKFQEKPLANGFFRPYSDFYCVWTENRTLSDIEKTDRHEHCHYLVENDYEHFCMPPYLLRDNKELLIEELENQ